MMRLVMPQMRLIAVMLPLLLAPLALAGRVDAQSDPLPGAAGSNGERSGSAGQAEPRVDEKDEADVKTLYEWTDDNGVVHFTDDPGKIPSEYRSRVRERKVKLGGGSKGRPSATDTLPEGDAGGDGEPAKETVKGPRSWGEDRWQQEQHALVERYERLYEEYQIVSREYVVSMAEGDPPAEMQRLREKRSSLEERLNELAKRLKSFPARVEKAGGNAIWVDSWSELELEDPPEERR